MFLFAAGCASTRTPAKEAQNLFDRGRVYARQGDNDLAIAYYNRGLELTPTFPVYLHKLDLIERAPAKILGSGTASEIQRVLQRKSAEDDAGPSGHKACVESKLLRFSNRDFPEVGVGGVEQVVQFLRYDDARHSQDC